ncbi:hypothetical protein SUGI_0099510 [Cryptomeria japonica]|nr:hypothetical protein SUGI_0099510 [Cryptomeria japonica]
MSKERFFLVSLSLSVLDQWAVPFVNLRGCRCWVEKRHSVSELTMRVEENAEKLNQCVIRAGSISVGDFKAVGVEFVWYEMKIRL